LFGLENRQGESKVSEDFYCEEVLSSKTQVNKVHETDNVLAYHHTRPFYPVHIVVIPKRHIPSLITLEDSDNDLLLEIFDVIKLVVANVTKEHGACRVLTNLGEYQDSKHLQFHIAFGKPLR
jgi:histidine triad (HIT) family protein